MTKFSFSKPLTLTLTLALFLQTSISTEIDDGYLEAHNHLRSAANVPPLRWDNTAFAAAKKLVEWQMKQLYGGPTLNSSMSKPYGMNVYSICTTRDLHSPEEDVWFWGKGKTMYDNVTRSCMEDIHGLCTNYRQMVWNETTELGCQRVRPSNDYCKNTGFGTFTVCLYYPPAPGNV